MPGQGDQRIEAAQPRGRRLHLAAAGIRGVEQNLAVEVGKIDPVVIDHTEPADAGGRKIEEKRRAEPARTDDEHAGVCQPPLADAADLGQHDLARIAPELLVAELVRHPQGHPGSALAIG